MAAKTASTTSGSSARMMSGDLPGRMCWVALGMKTEPTHRPVDGHHSPPIRASPKRHREFTPCSEAADPARTGAVPRSPLLSH